MEVKTKLSACAIHYSSPTFHYSSTVPISYYSWTVSRTKFSKVAQDKVVNFWQLQPTFRRTTTGHHYASIIELHPALCKANISFRQIIERRIENSEDQKQEPTWEVKLPSTNSHLQNSPLYSLIFKFTNLFTSSTNSTICNYISITNYL